MNSAIASASLLGFGDKSAAVAFHEFGVTLGKIYDVQEKQLKGEEQSRKTVNEEYNETQRTKKRKESDLANLLKGLNKGGTTRSKSGAKKKNNGMSLMSKILLGAGVVLAGKALYDTVSSKVFDSVKETIEDMVDPILDAFETVFNPIKEFFGQGEEETPDTDTNEREGTETSTSSGSGSTQATFDLIGRGEGGYNSVNQGRAGDTPGGAKSVVGKNLTDMTIGELIQAQQSGELFAVGKYQIIPDTMTGFLSTMGIKNNDKFDQATQEKFPQYVLDHKRPAVGDYLSGKSNNRKEAIQALSREFAAVGLAYPEAGRKRGQSRYAGKSGNKASISPEEMGKALDRDRKKLARGGRADGKKRKNRKGNGPKSENTIEQGKATPLKRQKGGKVFLHWAASGYNGASPDYHATIQGDGKVAKTRDYNSLGGKHTYRQNSEGIGISLAAMAGATTNNFGRYPVKETQYKAMAKLCAEILTSWGHGPSYVNDRTVPTHAEAGRDLPGDNYGPVAWGGDGSRWDLWKLYENDANGSGGPKIRNMIKGYMSSGDFEIESEEASTYVEGSGTPNMPGQGPSPDHTPGGVNPSAPPPPPTPPKTFDGMIEQLAAQALSPLLGALGAISGNPLPQSSQEKSSTNDGAGGAGAVSITDPNARALLNAIADAEGTSGHPNNGYNTMFTGKQFGSLKGHPRQVQSGGGHSSDAAGRYQFLSSTWDEYAKGRSMSPANQDAVALELVAKKRGVNLTDGLSKSEVYRIGQEWASVEGGPSGVPGGSYGGQSKYSAERFLEMYKAYGGKVQGLQSGGMVGQQINTGRMRGIQNAQMAKIRAAHQNRMNKKGPKVIQVPLPPMPSRGTPPISSSESFAAGGGNKMTASELADFNRRLTMGALA